MQITSIYIENFQGLRHADLALATPITMVCGLNGAGKSSLKEAINLALGGAARVDKKGDYKLLITEGEKKAQIIIGHDGAASSFALPSGKGDRADIAGVAEYLPFVLNAEAFARLDGKERRKLLFALTGSSAKPDAIMPLLEKRGVNMVKVNKIKPLLLSGFAAAQEQVNTYTSESRGAWKAVTGDTYGSVLAEEWAVQIPEGPAVTTTEIDSAIAEHGTVAAEIEKGVKFLGGLEEKRNAAAGHAGKLEKLTEAAGLLERAQNKLDATTKDLGEWEENFQTLKSELDAAQNNAAGCDCPGCGVKLKIVGNTLELHQGLVADTKNVTDLALETTKAREAVSLLKRTQANDQAALTTAQNAATELAELQKTAPEVVSDAKIKQVEDALTGQRLKSDQLRAKVNALKERQDLVAGADKTNTTAAGHHQDAKEWTLIEKALAPDGIPGEILAGALAPINSSLKKLSAVAGWPAVQIGTDMTITADGRLYTLLSESEQWRCDALIALVIAEKSGLNLVLLDRFDVLLAGTREQFFGLILNQARAGMQVITCGSLKAAPTAIPHKEFQVIWIEGGIAGGAAQLQKAG